MTSNWVIRSIRQSSLLIGVLVFVGLSTMAASATPIEDIPEGVAGALGITEYTAKMILAVAGMVSVGLLLAVFRLPVPGVLIIELGLLGVFVAIDWLSEWMLVLAAVLVAIMFASMVRGGLDIGASG